MPELKQILIPGIIPIFKPVGPTSHDIIHRLRKLTGVKKIGHAGTLDPLASGVLVVGIGRESTKKLGYLEKTEKEYLAVIRLGACSTTDDQEGGKTEIKLSKAPTLNEIFKVLTQFEGEIEQTPPLYSAIKIMGKPAYKYARANKPLRLKPRKVFIKDIKLVKYIWPELTIRAITGPGVYIRALARDIGKKLCTGGYLSALTRTRVGEFQIDQAIKLSEDKV